MKKDILRFITSVGLILLAANACCVTPSQPSIINSQNVGQLQAAAQIFASEMVSDLVWSTDSSSLIALSGSSALRLDGSSLETLDTFTFESAAALYAASPDGKTVAFSEDSYNIFLVDMSVTTDACTLYSPYWVGNLDFSPDGTTLLTSSMDEILVTLWNVDTGEQLQTISGFETAAPVYSAKFGEDGKHIIWISRATVQLTEIDSGAMGPSIGHEDFVVSVALSADGSMLATAAVGTVNDEFTPVIYLWDPSSGEASAELTYPEAFSVIAFSPDGSLLAAAADSMLVFWDTASHQQLAEIDAGSESILDLAFSPDGSSITTADVDDTITLWQVQE